MDRHLVAVKVSVKRSTNQRVKLNRLTLDQYRFKCLNAEAVQRRRAVQHHRVLTDHLVENIPNLGAFFLNQFLRLLDGRRKTLRVKL